MAPAALILFRESLEAVLVVGIILGFLARSGQHGMRKAAWGGVGAGIAASVVAAMLFSLLPGGFEGRAEQVFEGSTMLAGAALMLTLVAWVGRRGSSRQSLEAKVAVHGRRAVEGGRAGAWGIFLLVSVSILREGVETILFLAAATGGTRAEGAEAGRAFDAAALGGAALGLAAAVIVGAALLRASRRADLRTFFAVTNVLLILFAAGLVSHGLHEFEEAGFLPPLVERLWDINPPPLADGRLPAMHDHGSIGSILRGLFGYTGSPSLMELLGWAVTIAAAAGLWAAAGREKDSQTG